MKAEKKLNNNFIFFLCLCSWLFLQDSKIHAQEVKSKAEVSLSFSEDKDTKTITAFAIDEEGVPIEELDIYFYVKRTFSLLPFGDTFNTTDENGKVSVVFPNDLPGDTAGKVTIVVKIMESDIYDDLTMEIDKNWGLIAEADKTEEERSLWAAAANAPLTLVFTTSTMILVTWVIYWYIIYILFKISKIKPLKS